MMKYPNFISIAYSETTLMNLTSAYAPFVNGGKKIDPKLISGYKTEEENTRKRRQL